MPSTSFNCLFFCVRWVTVKVAFSWPYRFDLMVWCYFPSGISSVPVINPHWHDSQSFNSDAFDWLILTTFLSLSLSILSFAPSPKIMWEPEPHLQHADVLHPTERGLCQWQLGHFPDRSFAAGILTRDMSELHVLSVFHLRNRTDYLRGPKVGSVSHQH